MSESAFIQFWSLQGEIPYAEGSALQRELVEARAADRIPDTVLFLEHAPVVTRGRGLQWTGMPREKQIPLAGPLPPGIDFAESERGGDLTYHGPGQLVAYPIVKLDGHALWAPRHDVTAWIRALEAWLIRAFEQGYGLSAGVRENATGVWVGDRKLVSIGIAIRRWVSWHGIAINAVNSLLPFHSITPCGFAPEVMTRLLDLAPSREAAAESGWREKLETTLITAWAQAGGVEATKVNNRRVFSLSEALEWLKKN